MNHLAPIFVILSFSCIHPYEAVDLLKECSGTEDRHVTRGSFTCCSASPRNIPLQSGLDFQSWWKKCAVEPDSSNEDPVISSWRVFRCILFSGMKGKPLLPSTFTNLMTAKYPVTIKSQIVAQMSELENANMKFEVDVECLKRTPYPKVTLLRNLFYDIEWDVCDGRGIDTRTGIITTEPSMNQFRNVSALRLLDILTKSSSYSSTDLANALCEPCERRQEMYHRNGDCCSHVSIPFPFIYLPFRYGNQERVRQCAEDVVDDVGLPGDTTFAIHLKYLCYSSCEHYLSGTILESDLWSGVSALKSKTGMKILVMKMIPKYFSTKYKDEVLQYVLENFRGAWEETKTFESNMQLSQRDIRTVDKGKLKNLLTSCRAHRLIETVTNLYLNNLCLEQYTTDAKINTTTSRYPHSPFHNHSHFNPLGSSSTSSKEDHDVVVNFDWNPRDPDREEEDSDFQGTGRGHTNQRNRSSSSSSSSWSKQKHTRPASSSSGWK